MRKKNLARNIAYLANCIYIHKNAFYKLIKQKYQMT